MNMPPMAMSPSGSAAHVPSSAMSISGGMQMTFYWSKEVTLLFSSWKTTDLAQYLLSLVAICLFAMLHQWLSRFRSSLFSLGQTKPSLRNIEGGAEAPSSQLAGISPLALRSALAILFAINAATGYLLMLFVMSYNGGVFVAVLLGLLVAHFVFQSQTDCLPHQEHMHP